jgi:hypothetical protein
LGLGADHWLPIAIVRVYVRDGGRGLLIMLRGVSGNLLFVSLVLRVNCSVNELLYLSILGKDGVTPRRNLSSVKCVNC